MAQKFNDQSLALEWKEGLYDRESVICSINAANRNNELFKNHIWLVLHSTPAKRIFSFVSVVDNP